MFHCFRLFLAAYVLCFSIAGELSQPSSRAAIAATPTAAPVEPVEPSDGAGWLWILVPLAVVSSVIFAVKRQGAKEAEIARPLTESPHDALGMALPNQTCEERSPETALTVTTRLAKADSVEALIANLHSLDADKRRQGIWELGQRGDSRAIQPLVDLLVDSDSMQRSLILAAVSEIAVRSLKPMNRALMLSLQDESPDVRKNAIRDVTRIYDVMGQMSQLLQYAASDTDAEVQDTAQWALNQMSRMRSRSESEALPGSPQLRLDKQGSDDKNP